jgi:glucose-6-phosphate-specific signal transduction histidine kinase
VAWSVYTLFSFLMFPIWGLSVFLFSIPLTILGGWLYSYKGALFTTLLTIPLHYLLLQFNSDDPTVIREFINPFGIGSQLIFSTCAALLKSSQNRYHALNNSLDLLIKERTQDLEELTQYLIEAQQFENKELNVSLLSKPYEELEAMLKTCVQLVECLKTGHHPRVGDAENIQAIIVTCLQQLDSLNQSPLSLANEQDSIPQSIYELGQQVQKVSNARFTFPPEKTWQKVTVQDPAPLCEILFEAVGNALRHAEPTHINIGIEDDAETLKVFIENDGISLQTSRIEGMGLPLMRFRAARMGGQFSIFSLPDKKTRAECVIPKGS